MTTDQAIAKLDALGLMPLLRSWAGNDDPTMFLACVQADRVGEVAGLLDIHRVEHLVARHRDRLAYFVAESLPRAVRNHVPADMIVRLARHDAACLLWHLATEEKLAGASLSEAWAAGDRG